MQPSQKERREEYKDISWQPSQRKLIISKQDMTEFDFDDENPNFLKNKKPIVAPLNQMNLECKFEP